MMISYMATGGIEAPAAWPGGPPRGDVEERKDQDQPSDLTAVQQPIQQHFRDQPVSRANSSQHRKDWVHQSVNL